MKLIQLLLHDIHGTIADLETERRNKSVTAPICKINSENTTVERVLPLLCSHPALLNH